MDPQEGGLQEAGGAGQPLTGIYPSQGKWRANNYLAKDAEGRPEVGVTRAETVVVVSCTTQGEAAVARDLAVHWLQGLTPSNSKANAPLASYQQHCAAVLRQLQGIDTLKGLRVHVRYRICATTACWPA